MSLWTDRELKILIARVDALERLLQQRMESINNHPVVTVAVPTVDKRTKEYRDWKNANS